MIVLIPFFNYLIKRLLYFKIKLVTLHSISTRKQIKKDKLNMNTACVETLVHKITDFQYKSNKDLIALDNVMDQLLDAILEVQEIYTNQTDSFQELISLFNGAIPYLSREDYMILNDSMNRVIKNASRLYLRGRNHKFIYQGAKTHIQRFRNSIDSFKEVANDLDVMTELKSDTEFNEMLNELNLL